MRNRPKEYCATVIFGCSAVLVLLALFSAMRSRKAVTKERARKRAAEVPVHYVVRDRKSGV